MLKDMTSDISTWLYSATCCKTSQNSQKRNWNTSMWVRLIHQTLPILFIIYLERLVAFLNSAFTFMVSKIGQLMDYIKRQ